ncbi:glycosyltransferase family 2 protein [Candidatus Sumerlaeota bacterium]|nr:glycosyltransferase family 2 protein [Candidatus Sumerlaeota bacterium]
MPDLRKDAPAPSSRGVGSAPEWSIVVPAYNEAKTGRLRTTLQAIRAYVAQRALSAQILVIDDGSTDDTADLVAREFPQIVLLRNPENRGKGYSVRRGLLHGDGKYLLFTDADLSTPIKEIERFEKAFADGADIAIGSRALKDSRIEIRQSLWRETSGRIFNLLVRVLSRLPYHDTQCGFKAYRREVARRIARLQRLDGWAFDVEQLHLARLLGYAVREVPIRWINSPASRVRFFRDSSRMIVDTIRVLRTHYDLSDTA